MAVSQDFSKVSKATTTVDLPFNMGSQSRLDGKPYAACPYPSGRLRDYWREGWCSVDQDWPVELPHADGSTRPQTQEVGVDAR